jgi:hypothetical protein
MPSETSWGILTIGVCILLAKCDMSEYRPLTGSD